ncbi:efflux RND transporter permease subunit [Sporohalobacter salinus]|uniref:efflux RND transporter permease subunit n=1 Tax=Sporohalobacter salinus TaxID=1494606 RepID=UPI0019607260|nr:MMPL family transporter [Sporohalobacter salinus]MBM7624444.1 putative RND superfamily exporter protein [Sporohalobacter salinus]
MPSRLKLNKIKKLFGNTEFIIISLTADNVLNSSTLKKVKKLESKLKKLNQIEKVKSPFNVRLIAGNDNDLIIDNAISKIPITSKEEQQLKKKIKNNNLIYGNLIAKDFKAIAVVGWLRKGTDDQNLLKELNRIITNFPGSERIYLAGMPVTRAKIASNVLYDIKRFMPCGILIVLIFLYFCFKQLRGIILPVAVVIMSIVVSVGLASILNWKIQLITVILPVTLMAITNDYGIHIIAHYQEENQLKRSIGEVELSRLVIKNLGRPIVAAGITTIVGLLCLLAHIILPAQQLGILAAFGIGFALLASISFIPAVLSLLSRAEPIKVNGNRDNPYSLENVLFRISDFVICHPKKIIVVFLLIIILISSGVSLLRVDTNPINYFSSNSQIVKSNQIINKYFGGASTISVVAKGDIEDPLVMKKIAKLEKKLKEYEEIEQVTSISNIMRNMNLKLHNNKKKKFNRVPTTRNAISQYFLLYAMSEESTKLVDFERRHALIRARIKTNNTTKIDKIVASLTKYINNFEDSPFVFVGGFGDLLAELVDLVVRGQIFSLIFSVISIALIVMILFSSFIAGIMAVLPLILSIVSLFGLMGYLGIELNMVTALLSSIMIGVGVDYTIHFLWRYRKENKKGRSATAIKKTLTTTGRGIVFNALSVIIGFVILLISNFLPVQFFGFLVVVSISSCLIGTLVFLPAVCIAFKPKFLD